jgi:hypothetical protein
MSEGSTIACAALAVVVSLAGCGRADGDGVEKITAAVMLTECTSFPATDICVCTDPDLTGSCMDLNGFTRYFMNLSTFPGLQQLNDKITSISVGALARGKICADPGGNGNCGDLQPGTVINDLSQGQGCPGHSCTSGANFGWGCKCMNDNITSIRIDQDSFDCLNPGPEQASIFEDPNFNNGMHKPSLLSRDCVVLNLGNVKHYPNPFWNATDGETGGGYGLNTDVISSVKLGPGAMVDLYADPSFSGTLFQVRADAPTLPSSINDRTSSIVVF